VQLETNSIERTGSVPSSEQSHWYAIHTRPNHEKRVAAQLKRRDLDQLLPLYDSIRQWKDRKVRLAVPLFPGYVFVRIALRERLRVLEIPGVANIVGFGNQPARLPEEDIQAIQCCVTGEVNAAPYPYLQVGGRARVKGGPLSGLEGTIVRYKNCARLVLSFELLRSSISVEVNQSDLEPAHFAA
jgi:transcription antitermination factor NusG